jgi:hypothetical protein
MLTSSPAPNTEYQLSFPSFMNSSIPKTCTPSLGRNSHVFPRLYSIPRLAVLTYREMVMFSQHIQACPSYLKGNGNVFSRLQHSEASPSYLE